MDDTSAFGYSLLLDDGDLLIENGQLVIVTGQANLTQALTLRILTPYGSDQFNTAYGMDVAEAFTQANGPRMVKDLIRLNLVRTLGTDPRVTEIRSVLFDDDPAFLALHPEVDGQTLRDQHHRRSWVVEVEVETVQNQPATLNASVGV